MPSKEFNDLCESFWQYYFAGRYPDDRDLGDWWPGKRFHTSGYNVDEANLKVHQGVNNSGAIVSISKNYMGKEPAESVQVRVAAYLPALRQAGAIHSDAWRQIEDDNYWMIDCPIDPYDRDNWPAIAEFLHTWLHICRNILTAPPPNQA